MSQQPEPLVDDPDEISFILDAETNQVQVSWQGEKPDAVSMSMESLLQWVEDRNRMVRTMEAQHAVLTIVRLGRRPNADDWDSVGLLSMVRQEPV